MNEQLFTHLHLREVFHLEFLRWFSRKVEARAYCLKGGVNLRFFFNSIRYSEDVDIDITNVRAERLQNITLGILGSRSFLDNLRVFRVREIIPPDMRTAKQTETTQRFKVHLMTSRGEDLFTKIEFSRRPTSGNAVVESVSAAITRYYKTGQVILPHYDASSAIAQKISALAARPALQARDVFDLFVLSAHYTPLARNTLQVDEHNLKKASENITCIDFLQFNNTVVAFLEREDQRIYSSPEAWADIQHKARALISEYNQ